MGSFVKRRPYSLAVFCDSTEIGGAERFLGSLIGGLPSDVDVTVVGPDRRVVDALARARPTASTQLTPLTYRSVLHILRSLRPDIAHANLTTPTGCRGAILAALSLRVPIVMVDHLPLPGLTWKGRALQRFLTCRSAARVSVGDASSLLVERYAGLPHGSVRTIPNAIPRMSPVPAPSGKGCVFGFLGRLEPQKGVDVLLQALSSVPEATVEIMGSGTQRDALTAAVSRLGLSDRVRLTAGSPETAPFWRRIDVLVLPSRAEGLPLVVLEALNVGRPVIASDVGSVRDVLDEEVAVLVRPEDVLGLAAALRLLARDRNLRDRLAANALDRARSRWSVADMVAAYDDLYRTALRQ